MRRCADMVTTQRALTIRSQGAAERLAARRTARQKACKQITRILRSNRSVESTGCGDPESAAASDETAPWRSRLGTDVPQGHVGLPTRAARKYGLAFTAVERAPKGTAGRASAKSAFRAARASKRFPTLFNTLLK